MRAISLLSQRQQVISAVVSPLFISQQLEEAVPLQAHLDTQTCLGECCLHLRVLSACMYVEESALKITASSVAWEVMHMIEHECGRLTELQMQPLQMLAVKLCGQLHQV